MHDSFSLYHSPGNFSASPFAVSEVSSCYIFKFKWSPSYNPPTPNNESCDGLIIFKASLVASLAKRQFSVGGDVSVLLINTH